MMTMIMVEPVLAMTLILGAVRTHSLGLGSAVFGTAGAGYSRVDRGHAGRLPAGPPGVRGQAAVRHRRGRDRDPRGAVHRVQRPGLRAVPVST
ncbi:MAG: hypothetical protein MZV63_65480 [Marinilabiliales bacterium]|nr:hypothetical protein [Marinilabiliales bacterium]